MAFGSASPPPNAADWNNTAVSVAFTATDGLSGVDTAATTASPLLLTAEGSAVTGAVTVVDKAGNTATATSSAFRIDKTSPTITGARNPAPNALNWNNTPVTVSFDCSDALSGLAPGSPPADTVLSTDGANQSVSGSCQDLAGNTASVTVDDIDIDQTPPTAEPAATPPPNANGWNSANVTVSFSATDGGSGIASCTAPVILNTEGSGQSATGTCTDNAGNTSAPATKTGINIDKTGPVLTFGSPTPSPNAAGWNNTNVSIAFSATDAVSGVETIAPASPLVLTTEGSAVTGSVTVTDKAGNTSIFNSPVLQIDKTAPSLTASRIPTPNASGWNNTDVTVTFTCADVLAGVAALTPAAPVVVSSEGANQSVPGACSDRAGNTAALTVAPINIDKAKPVVTDVVPDPSAVPVNNGFTLTATAVEAGSGAELVEYNINGGGFTALTLLDAAAGKWRASVSGLDVGVYTVCVRSKDRAENQGDAACILVPVYDPTGGFVTGGGWITSPLGAYASNPSLTGKAHFGFVSKYLKGANVPSGNTEFQFQVANFRFKSTVYEWLVIAGARAQFKGSGTINGSGDYGFLLTGIDGQVSGGGGVDKFRIKVWDKTTGGILYDNQMGADDTGNASTALGGGSIVIHQ